MIYWFDVYTDPGSRQLIKDHCISGISFLTIDQFHSFKAFSADWCIFNIIASLLFYICSSTTLKNKFRYWGKISIMLIIFTGRKRWQKKQPSYYSERWWRHSTIEGTCSQHCCQNFEVVFYQLYSNLVIRRILFIFNLTFVG